MVQQIMKMLKRLPKGFWVDVRVAERDEIGFDFMMTVYGKYNDQVYQASQTFLMEHIPYSTSIQSDLVIAHWRNIKKIFPGKKDRAVYRELLSDFPLVIKGLSYGSKKNG